jgi:hypothetical protein
MIGFIFFTILAGLMLAGAYGHLFGKPEAMPINKKTGQPHKQSKIFGVLFCFLACIPGLLALDKLTNDVLKPEPPKTLEQIAHEKAVAAATRLNGERRDQLERYLKQQARDPSSVEFRNAVVVANGVCVEMNGKNAFGGYAGWSRFCGIIDKTGKMIVSEIE